MADPPEPRLPEPRTVRRPGLLPRLVLALALVGLIPVGLASIQLVGINRTAIQEQVLRTHAVAAATAAGRVESFLRERLALLRASAANPGITADPATAGEVLSGLLQARPDLVAVSLRLRSTGEEVLRAQRRSQAEEVEPILERGAESPVIAIATRSGTLVRLQAAIPEAPESLVLVADLGPLGAAFTPKELGREAHLALLQAPDEAILGSSVDSFSSSLVAHALGGQTSGSGRFTAADRRQVLGAYAPVVGTPWAVVSQQPLAIADEVSRRMWRGSLLAIVSALLVTALLSVGGFVYLVRPIRQLIAAQRRLAGSASDTVGGNEIDQLQQSFALLARRMRDREDLGRVFLGRYQVSGLLGSGGMGTVFRAWDPKLERPVALKTVHFSEPTADRSRDPIASLLREAVVVARFSHPNIVAIYDLEESPTAAFLAMELVEGFTLEEYLGSRSEPLPIVEAATLCLRIAQALDAAHRHGVVHHDVKPANVLIGRDDTIKVGDFGVAQMVASVASSPDQEAVYGTPGYLPPETLLEHSYDAAGDRFALGVILYRCLTGEHPIPGRSVREIVLRTIRDRIPPLESRHPELPAALSQLTMQLLARDPAKRPDDESILKTLASYADEVWNPSRQLPTLEGASLPTSPLATETLYSSG